MNRIMIALSVFMNAVLLMVLFGPLHFFLFLSILLLFASGFYIFHLLAMRKESAQEIEMLIDKISLFSSYLEGIHELEVFYGDETIQEMIEQSKHLMNDFCDFEEKYLDREYYEEEENDGGTKEKNDETAQI